MMVIIVVTIVANGNYGYCLQFTTVTDDVTVISTKMTPIPVLSSDIHRVMLVTHLHILKER